MVNKIIGILALSGVLLLGTTAGAITVDGTPTDWLGSAAPSGQWTDAASQWTYINGLSKPGSPLNDFAFMPNFPADDVANNYANYYIEDGPGEQVGPGYGGQNFDVEAMYVWYVNNDTSGYAEDDGLYVGVFTGFDSNGEGGGHGDYVSSTWYKPGDIFFDIGGDGTWDFAIEAFGDASSVEGHVYASTGNPSWWTTPTDFASSRPYSINHSRAVDVTAALGLDSALVYSDYASDHNFIEAFVDELLLWEGQEAGYWSGLSETGDTTLVTHWTQSCGNDVANVAVSSPPAVPEPATMAMLGCLGLGMLAARKIRSKKS